MPAEQPKSRRWQQWSVLTVVIASSFCTGWWFAGRRSLMQRAEALHIGQTRREVMTILGKPTSDSAKRRYDPSTAFWDEPGERQLAAISNFIRDVSGRAQIRYDLGVTVHFGENERVIAIDR